MTNSNCNLGEFKETIYGEKYKLLSQFTVYKPLTNEKEIWQLVEYENNIYGFGIDVEVHYGLHKSHRGTKEEIINQINSIIRIHRASSSMILGMGTNVKDLKDYDLLRQFHAYVVQGFREFKNILQ